MDRYFEVLENSKPYQDYYRWLNNRNEVNSFVKDFMIKHEIETREYYASKLKLYIVPTDNDKKKFLSMLSTKEEVNGLRAFKTKSLIGKAWSIKELKILHKPSPIDYFMSTIGHFSTRIFHVSDSRKVYCSITSSYDFNETAEGFEEIKGSEFHKVMESLT